jgi:cytochrome c-type biogenesis protein CcmH
MTLLAWNLVVLLFTAAQPAPALAATVPVPALEQEARQIERMLIAPCCWMQPVSEHSSEASDEVKRQIRQWLGQGMTRQQVLDAFVEQYGVRILAEPPNRGVGRFLYLTPWLVFGLSSVGLVVLVKKLSGGRAGTSRAEAGSPVSAGRPPAGPETGEGAASATEYEQQLDDELRDLD